MFPPGRARLATKFRPDRVANKDENYRDRFGQAGRIRRRVVSNYHQDIDSQRYEFGSHVLKPIRDFIGEAMLKLDVYSIDVAEVLEALQQRTEIRCFLLGATRVPKHSDLGHPFG
jgi:hypothetical protein